MLSPRMLLLSLGLAHSLMQVAAAAPPYELAAEGKTLTGVVVPKQAPERIRQAGQTLAEYLQRITGATFAVRTGDGASGIALGRPQDFAGLHFQPPWKANDPTHREDYILRTHAAGLFIIGASELAVEHAVWDVLYRLGHRQFFPGETWEIVPRQPNLSLAVDTHEHPDYLARRFWYGFGPWGYAAEPYAQWCARNRALSGVVLNTGHAYDGILSRNREVFRAHPEYLGLVDGERKSTKFCISNLALRRLVIEDALKQFRQDPARDSISMDPSDGPGWCECDACQAMGSISDRALTLANEVAAAVNEQYPGKYIGMYAYSAHSPPPNVRVHPQVIVSVATAYVRGGYGVDELLAGWSRQGATLGIREYFSVNTWDRDLPGRARGSDLGYTARTIPHFHLQGARFFSAESSDNWGPNGLGYYLAARTLWNVEEAKQVEALTQDFLHKAFENAKEPMAEFYRLLDGGTNPLLSDDLLGRMYRQLQAARRASDDPAVHKRLDDLTLYTRYVELYFDYSHAANAERQAKFEAMLRHVYRMRKTMMVHAKALYRDVARRDKLVEIPPGAEWDVPEEINPWKSSEPFPREEMGRLTREGIARRPLRGFEAADYSLDLVPVNSLALADSQAAAMDSYSRGLRTYYTWVADPEQPLRLTVQAGRIYQDRGPAKVTLSVAGTSDPEVLQTVLVPPDGTTQAVELKAPKQGLYVVGVSDGGAGTIVQWPAGRSMTLVSSLEHRAEFHGRWSLYFYVPKGTRTVSGYSAGPGTLLNSKGANVFTFDSRPGYFSVPVPEGEDGKLWKFQHCAGQRLLMTVPPCLARSSQELLLPAEVVERDGIGRVSR